MDRASAIEHEICVGSQYRGRMPAGIPGPRL